MRKMLAHQFRRSHRRDHVVDGEHKDLGVFGLGRAQQVELGRVAEIGAAAEAADRLHLFCADVERRERNVARVQHPADDLTDPSETGDDHAWVGGVGDAVERGGRPAAAGTRHQGFVDHEQQRRQRHRHGHHHDQELDRIGTEHTVGQRHVEQHERELAGMTQQHGEAANAIGVVAGEPPHRNQDDCLDQHQCESGANDRDRMRDQQSQVGRHADRNEEQPQQQALERVDAGFDLVAVLRISQQHAGEKGTERHRQAHAGHEQRGADDHEQGAAGEDFLDLRFRDHPKHRAQQIAPADDHQGDHRHRLERAEPRIGAVHAFAYDQ